MKAESNRQKIAKRLDRNRPMTSVTLRMPEDIVDELKTMAPALGFSGYQPLIRAYIGQGMRKDQQQLDKTRFAALVENLRNQGVSEELILRAISEIDRDDDAA
jgi:Ca2+-binding EF-hand superfamily protein